MGRFILGRFVLRHFVLGRFVCAPGGGEDLAPEGEEEERTSPLRVKRRREPQRTSLPEGEEEERTSLPEGEEEELHTVHTVPDSQISSNHINLAPDSQPIK